mmetsp:Transcript_76722/g.124133  ORF Transcript_76722/g.124133 Transcript_76722/m.124133 type:complete len:204 (-) Transcript_76722:68-679(-)
MGTAFFSSLAFAPTRSTCPSLRKTTLIFSSNSCFAIFSQPASEKAVLSSTPSCPSILPRSSTTIFLHSFSTTLLQRSHAVALSVSPEIMTTPRSMSKSTLEQGKGGRFCRVGIENATRCCSFSAGETSSSTAAAVVAVVDVVVAAAAAVSEVLVQSTVELEAIWPGLSGDSIGCCFCCSCCSCCPTSAALISGQAIIAAAAAL